MSTYLIGDVQGCYQELCLLLEKIAPSSDDDIWLLGDLINRGPDNVSVLDLAIAERNVHAILGNHDLHFLAVANGQQTMKRQDTVSDLLDSARRIDYVEYLRHRSLHHFVDGDNPAMFVHAGIPTIFSAKKVIELSSEVTRVLQSDQSDHIEAFLTAMYGNTPAVWKEDLKGLDRLRVITNYLTRLRYCTEDGAMELNHKSNIEPPGFAPWFSFARDDNLSIYFGHWAALEGRCAAAHAEALDTGCVWGGTLTAMKMEDGHRISVSAAARDS